VPQPHDLAISKLAAGREKDLHFIAAMLRYALANPAVLRERLADTPLDSTRAGLCQARLLRLLT
jgi:hypothetical protein